MVEPASHSHSNGCSVIEHSCRPSTKKATLWAVTLGSTATRIVVTPLTYASGLGALMMTGDAGDVTGAGMSEGASAEEAGAGTAAEDDVAAPDAGTADGAGSRGDWASVSTLPATATTIERTET
jgi:hypothetical protein